MKKEIALNNFKNGFNCSQAILSAYCEEYGLDMENAINLSIGFGGGLGRQGKLCGCLSAAIIVLGLKYGKNSTKDTNIRIQTYDLVKDFCHRFSEINGAIDCKDIIRYNLDNPEDRVVVQEKNIFQTRCTKVISNTITQLETILGKQTD